MHSNRYILYGLQYNTKYTSTKCPNLPSHKTPHAVALCTRDFAVSPFLRSATRRFGVPVPLLVKRKLMRLEIQIGVYSISPKQTERNKLKENCVLLNCYIRLQPIRKGIQLPPRCASRREFA